MTNDEAKETVKRGYELFQREQYNEAFPLLMQGVEQGFIPAYAIVGDCFWDGLGVEESKERAIQYYLAGAELGDLTAMVRTANVYYQVGDMEKAVSYFSVAADKGDPDALFNLGNIYYVGIEPVDRNYEKAIEYFERFISAVPDDAEALHILGRCYAFRKDRDTAKAEELFVKAALLGNQMAARDRDVLQLGGILVE